MAATDRWDEEHEGPERCELSPAHLHPFVSV